jgi:hypothetical protein
VYAVLKRVTVLPPPLYPLFWLYSVLGGMTSLMATTVYGLLVTLEETIYLLGWSTVLWKSLILALMISFCNVFSA